MGINSNRVENLECRETVLTIPAEAMPAPPQPEVEIHKVCLPPNKTTFQKLKHKLSEVFFPDDPFHRFKNQTWVRKVLLGLQFLFPVFQWGPDYTLALFKSDIVSGLTIASLAIPQVWWTRFFMQILIWRLGWGFSLDSTAFCLWKCGFCFIRLVCFFLFKLGQILLYLILALF